MQGTRVTAYVEEHSTLGLFEVGGRVYAVDASGLREVVRWQSVTPLPGAPALIEGIIDLRGALVPVVDLGRALGGPPVARSPATRIAVIEVGGLVVGLVVDAALEVLPVAADRLEPPPVLAGRAGYDAARAIVRRPGDDPIPVLSLERLLERIHCSSPSATEDPS